MLAGRIDPQRLSGAIRTALRAEAPEQLVTLLLDLLQQLFWRFSAETVQQAEAAGLEADLRAGVERAATASAKAAWFRTLIQVVTSPSGIDYLEALWTRAAGVAGLELGERAETELAEQLALRRHPDTRRILTQQVERIADPDRRARFEFLLAALSPEPEERDAFFARIGDAGYRRREPWVVAGLGFLNHPLRATAAIGYLRPGLERLAEIEATGDIFLPRDWLTALFSGHASPAAADRVERFLDERGEAYPVRLRRLILQTADPLLTAASLRRRGATGMQDAAAGRRTPAAGDADAHS
jgi:aminopeptidase N